MIRITDSIAIDEKELDESFVRSSGPGGQNVNKVETAVQLRFDVSRTLSLDGETKMRLRRIAGRKVTEDGILVIDARRFRTQERNRADALERLVEMIRKALVAPARRVPTRPKLGAKRARVEAKRHRAAVKAGRGPGGYEE